MGDSLPGDGAAAALAGGEEIYFAGSLKEPPKAPLLALAPQVAVWGLMGVIFLIIVAFGLGGLWVHQTFGRSALFWYIALTVVLALVAMVRVLYAPTRRAYLDGMEMTRLPLVAKEGPRVRCIGSDGAVRRLGEISREPFEPMIVRAVLVDRPTRAFYWVWGVSALVSAGLLYLGLRAAGASMLSGFPTAAFGQMYFAFGVSAGTMVAGFVFPCYIRIAPGRVDVLKFPALGLGRPTISKHDVRHGNVTLLLRARAAVLQPFCDSKDVYATIMYAGALGQRDIARAILAASISEHPTPPMPDDALIG